MDPSTAIDVDIKGSPAVEAILKAIVERIAVVSHKAATIALEDGVGTVGSGATIGIAG